MLAICMYFFIENHHMAQILNYMKTVLCTVNDGSTKTATSDLIMHLLFLSIFWLFSLLICDSVTKYAPETALPSIYMLLYNWGIWLPM